MARSLEDLRQWFNDFVSGTQTARDDAEKACDYRDGKQWTAEEVEELSKRGQAPIVVNRIKPKIDALLGMEIQGRVDPRAFPRNPGDEMAAEAATDALRFIEDKNVFDEQATAAADNLFVQGIEVGEVTVRKRGDEMDILARHIPYERFWYDPLSRRRDFSDRRYAGVITWMDMDSAEAKWKGKGKILEDTIHAGQREMGEDFNEKPISNWVDPKRKRVAVLECYYSDGGEVYRCVFVWGGFLENPKVSGYLDQYGNSRDPYVVRHAFIDREYRRYGLVKNWIPLQDEINHRRSKALFLLSVRQTFGNDSAIDDTEEAKNQLSRPGGHLRIVHGQFGKDFGVLPTGDMAQGQFLLLQEAKDEIDGVGVNRELSGEGRAGQSGRALQALQSAGALELQPVIDAHRSWRRGMYEYMWLTARQYWHEPKWIRVTDDEKKARFVQLNRPETVGDLMQAAQQGPQGQKKLQAVLQMLVQRGLITNEQVANADPAMMEIETGGTVNDVAQLDVDIIVDMAPDTVTIQQEQFEVIAQLANARQDIPTQALIMASQLRDKDKILEMLKQPEPTPEQQQAMQLDLADKQAGVEQKLSQASKNKASALKDITEASQAQAGLEAIG